MPMDRREFLKTAAAVPAALWLKQLPLTAVPVIGPQGRWFLIGEQGEIRLSEDQGTTWETVLKGGEQVHAIHLAAGQERIYARLAGPGGRFILYSDDGLKWRG